MIAAREFFLVPGLSMSSLYCLLHSIPGLLPGKVLETGDFFFFAFLLLGLYVQHMEVPRLGVKSEQQPLATATATPDPSCVCDLDHSSRQ